MCDVHRRVWVDNVTGLRLAGEPDNAAKAHAEVCEFWPSDLEKLFRAAGVPRAGPPREALRSGVSSSPGGSDATKGPCIVSPKKGLIYHVRVENEAGETLSLEATAETSREMLHWFVDAAYVGVSEPSASLAWRLAPGRHVIRAVDDAGRADSREIVVTAVE